MTAISSSAQLREAFPSDVVARLRRNLRRWHVRHGRSLPWRAVGDPYRVWISEIMLQQTTVAAVLPYFKRFLQRFPNVQALAAAAESDVLRLWEGLGYYSRARNIHRTARLLVEEYAAEFPRDLVALRALPGIGRYTAGAIVSFAFDEPAPIVEANTLRLYSRLLGYGGDPRAAAGQKLLWAFAELLLPRRGAGEFNQALIDVGATVCVPSNPRCPECPLRWACRAFRGGLQSTIPRLPQRAAVTEITEAAVAIHKRGAYLLRRRGESERWAGLWDFPRFELECESSANGRSISSSELSSAQTHQLAEQVRLLTGIGIQLPVSLTTIRHSVTRYRITLRCLRADFASGRLSRTAASCRWVRLRDLGEYPLSVTGRKLADHLAAR